jgi:hypothetical protein
MLGRRRWVAYGYSPDNPGRRLRVAGSGAPARLWQWRYRTAGVRP